jgi:hypothetical protein
MIRIVIALMLVTMVAACSSTLDPVPDSPDVDIQEVFLDKPCIVQIEIIASAILLAYPAFSEEEAKAWAKEFRRINKRNLALKDAEIRALRHQITKHNKLEPKCLN